MARPKKEFNAKLFADLVGLGCNQKEICWIFRDEKGKPANIDTLSRWCKRKFGMTYQDYSKNNCGIARNIELRKAQMTLAKKSAAMAIFLGKNYLDQQDSIVTVDNTPIIKLDEILQGIKENALNEKKKQKEAEKLAKLQEEKEE